MLLTGWMTTAPAILSIKDKTEWHAESLPTIDVALRSCIYGTDWLDGEPSVFDTQHHETARFYETNSGVSPSILGKFDPDLPGQSIPMGYTNLYLFEKRAVIADGKLVRLWRQRWHPAPELREEVCSAITEGTVFSHLRVGLDFSIGHAVGQAEVLSARMNGAPVVVARMLTATGWH